MIELVYDIGRKIDHHFMANLYKAGDVVAYKETQMLVDEKLSPHC